MLRPLTNRQITVDAVIALTTFLLFLIWAGLVGSRGILLLSGYCAALFFRRLGPGIALGIAWLVSIVQMLMLLEPTPINLLVLPILFATAAHGSTLERWLGFISSFAAAFVIAAYLVILPAIASRIGIGPITSRISTDIVSAAFLFGAALAGFLLSWTAGLLYRTWAQARQSRVAASEAEREVVAEQERTRIARDMHDVVAHSLAVVIAQADGARYLRKTDPEAVDGALETIASTAREALADVRVLLAQLRHRQGDAPQPVLADLSRLYEQVRSSGLDVREEEAGAPLSLGTSPQLAVYRIVQESLTNALRHGDRTAPVTVRFDWAASGLHLSITNTALEPERSTAPLATLAAGGSAGAQPMTGHGIAGMSERAALVGGNLAAVRDGDRFTVRAWLPATDLATIERTLP